MKKLLTTTIAVLCAAMAFADSATPVITAWRTSINSNDPTDFASMYVSDLGTTITGNAGYAAGTVSYLWEKSANGTSDWATYADGLGSATNNIRPIKAAYYRCTVTLKDASKTDLATATSNTIQVTGTSGSTVTISSNIPVIVIRTDSASMPDCSDPLGSEAKMYTAKQKRSADCKIIWNKETTDGTTAIYDGDDFDAHNDMLYYDKKIRINYRGSSSLTKTIKNYAFACGDDNCGTNGQWVKGKEKMFKLSDKKDKDWILYGANDDQATLARNTLQLDLYEEMTGNWNSHCRYARLYVDGVDKGIYIFMEKVKQSEARVNVDESTGFIFKYDKTDRVDRYENAIPATDVQGNPVEENKCTFITDNAGKQNIGTYGITVDHGYEVVFPEYGDFTSSEWDAKITDIKARIGNFETAVKNQSYSDLRTYIDYESFADYFIIQELAKNVDGYRISQYFYYKNSTAKLMAEPLWDTELGMAQSTAKGASSTEGLIIQNSDMYSTGDAFYIPFWWTGSTSSYSSGYGIYGDVCFKAKVKQRWAQHTATGGPLTVSNITAKLATYGNSTGKTSSEITNWIGDGTSSGRLYQLGQIINGWSVTTYVNSVTANFNGEESTVLEKQVAMDGSVTMEASATASSGTATLYYSWQRSDDGESNWVTLVDDDTSNSHTFSDIQESGYYRARAKSSDCDCIKYSSSNVLHVVVPETKVTCK